MLASSNIKRSFDVERSMSPWYVFCCSVVCFGRSAVTDQVTILPDPPAGRVSDSLVALAHSLVVVAQFWLNSYQEPAVIRLRRGEGVGICLDPGSDPGNYLIVMRSWWKMTVRALAESCR